MTFPPLTLSGSNKDGTASADFLTSAQQLGMDVRGLNPISQLQYVLANFQSQAPPISSIGVFNVQDPHYGAKGNGVADDTTAIARAVAAASLSAATNDGAVVYFPPGVYNMTDTVQITGHRVHLCGAEGKYGATITFTPTSAKACFKFQRTDTSEILYQCSLRNMSFVGGGSEQKIAIDLWDCSETNIENIAVASSWTGNSGSSTTPSIGIRTHGRDTLTVSVVDIFADRPIHITANPNSATLGCDHFHFRDMYLGINVSTEYGYVIDADISVTNLTLDGYQAIVLGRGALWCKPGSPPQTNLVVDLAHIRYEQPADNTGYAIRWEAPTYNLIVRSVNAGGSGSPTNGGFYFRNVNKITLLNTMYTGQGEALNLDSTCAELNLINTFWQDSGTTSISPFEVIYATPTISVAAPLPSTAYYFNNTSTVRQTTEWGVTTAKKSTSLTNNGTYNLQAGSTGTLKTGQVRASAYSSSGPTRAMGIWHIDGTGAALIAGTANAAVGLVASKLCLLWNSISSIQIANTLGVTVDVVIEEEWTV